MKPRHLVMLLAAGSLLGCRDFSLPGEGAEALRAEPAFLDLVPTESAAIHLRGGHPPYHLGGPTAQAEDYAYFDLAASGSGGWAFFEDGSRTRLAYTAGAENPAEVDDVLEVVDSVGAVLQVPVRVGPRLKAQVAGAPASAIGRVVTRVPAGGTTFLGATGGRPPYLYGLAIAPSQGMVDAVTGRYRAGPVGCVTDRVLVVDAVGAQSLVEVEVECAPLPGSPDRVFAALRVDLGSDGTDELAYVTREPGGARLLIPGAGGLMSAIYLGGTPQDAIAVRRSGHIVVAVEMDDDTTRILGAQPGAFFSGPIELAVLQPGDGPVRLAADESDALDAPMAFVASWPTASGVWMSTLVASYPGSTGGPFVPVRAPLATRELFVVPTEVPGVDGGQRGFLSAGVESSGSVTLLVEGVDALPILASLPTPLSAIHDVAAGRGPGGGTRIALLGAPVASPAERQVQLVSLQDGVFSNGPTLPVPEWVEAVRLGQLDAWPGDELILAGAGRLGYLDATGALQQPWNVGGAPRRLRAVGLDGDPVTDLLLSDHPGGGPAIRIDPLGAPPAGEAVGGVYGADTLVSASVGPRPGRRSGDALLAVDLGRDPSGRRAPGSTAGGLVMAASGPALGQLTALDVSLEGDGPGLRVVAAASARLGEAQTDPADVVAALRDADGRHQLRLRRAIHEGRLEPATALDLPDLGEVRWIRRMAWEGREALLVASALPAGDVLHAVVETAAGVTALAPLPVEGRLSEPGWLDERLEAPTWIPVLLRSLDAQKQTASLVRIGPERLELIPIDVPLPADLEGPVLAVKTGSAEDPVYLLGRRSGKLAALSRSGVFEIDPGLTVDHLTLVRQDRGGKTAHVLIASDQGAAAHLAFGAVERPGAVFAGCWVLSRTQLGEGVTGLSAGRLVGDDPLADVAVGGWPLLVLPGLAEAMPPPRSLLWGRGL